MKLFLEYRKNVLKQKTLNHLVSNLLINVADEYLTKLKKDKKNPPLEIQRFLNNSVYLTEQKINIKKINNKIVKRSDKETKEFVKVMKENEDYKDLIIKFAFTLALIKDEELQERVIDKIYKDFQESKESYDQIREQRNKIFNFTKFFNFRQNNYVANI